MVIENVRQTTETTNEYLSAVVQRDTLKTGYNKFHLDDFKDLETPLENSVIERIKKKLTQVQDFKVATMFSLPSDVRSQIVEFAADVIEQHESQMTAIDFGYLNDALDG